jgi:hypothetical protein
MARTVHVLPVRGMIFLASSTSAQVNPLIRDAIDLIERLIGDSAKHDALCSYYSALGQITEASKPAPFTALDVLPPCNVAARRLREEEKQIEPLRKLGAAQSGERIAANQVDPGFHDAMDTLMIGDTSSWALMTFKIHDLCTGK